MFLQTIRLKCRPSRKIINLKCTPSYSQISMEYPYILYLKYVIFFGIFLIFNLQYVYLIFIQYCLSRWYHRLNKEIWYIYIFVYIPVLFIFVHLPSVCQLSSIFYNPPTKISRYESVVLQSYSLPLIFIPILLPLLLQKPICYWIRFYTLREFEYMS